MGTVTTAETKDLKSTDTAAVTWNKACERILAGHSFDLQDFTSCLTGEQQGDLRNFPQSPAGVTRRQIESSGGCALPSKRVY
jgi:hypothetical protein